MKLEVKRLKENATLPTYGSEGSIGLDLYAASDLVIPPGGRAMVPTGIAVAIPSGYYGRVAPRSGLAAKHGIDTLAGVIDSDYRGEVFVLLMNHGGSEFGINKGDRVSQLILERADRFEIEEVGELDPTIRNYAGFGSTGC